MHASAIPDLISDLKKVISGEVRADLATRILYSTDASIYQIEPLGVVIPRTLDDLAATMALAAKYRVPVLPRGSGSSLAGQAIGAALIIDCSRWLDRIHSINAEEQSATVEPGVILAVLNKAAAKHGLQFGPDPASAERATMGGVIGNNATGAHSILYGMTADHILEADVVMADGNLAVWGRMEIQERGEKKDDSLLSSFIHSSFEIREKYVETIKQHFPHSWRNSAGYRLNYLLPWSSSRPPLWGGKEYPASLKPSSLNLAPLLAGSEGTLAIIRTAKVNLVRKPRHTVLGVLAYDSIAESCDAVPDLLKHEPSAIELIPQMLIRLARNVPAYASQLDFVHGDPAALLAIEFSGDDPNTLIKRARALGAGVLIAETPAEQASIWSVRKVGLGILDSRFSSERTTAIIEDCAIPVDHLGDFVRGVERIMSDHGVIGAFYAHASAGCLHVRPILNLKTRAGVQRLRAIAEETLALTLSLGGAMSSEHGDGIARAEFLRQTYGDEIVEAFRTLKRAADPHNLLNPGKIIDPPRMDSQLRYGESYRAQAWRTALDFSSYNGLDGAIEQCNGQGVCRKFDGVMCPSFQATRDEAFSTRGRANLLRAMISNRLPANNKQRMEILEKTRETLDLCLACKGCKSECPSGVDMAKLKFAFEDDYYKSHRRPLRDYLFGYFHVVAALMAPVAPLANLVMQVDWARKLIAQMMAIAPQRPFPRFVSQHARASRSDSTARLRVLFLTDAFTHYVEPHVEQAAFDVLHLAGYHVQVLPIVGAGASLLSKGMLDAARRHASAVIEAIRRIDSDGAMLIVGVEPPEVYAIKNDYVDLLPGRRDEVNRVARRAWLLDEFLIRQDVISKLRVSNIVKEKAEITKLKFHPHCHQRAEGPADDGFPNGVNATVAVLRACGYEVEVTDAGCCGMAGTFGYEAEHYELSQQVGALRLFPEVAGRGAARMVSTGAACRMQIEQGTGASAEHSIVLTRERLKVRGVLGIEEDGK
jgi:FAD/FMN-containing dehydrogenase/Fe-S oxidoreductase